MILLFTTCKKYPENNLWFKNQSNVLARGEEKPWLLDYYAVNDIDSTHAQFLEVWKKDGVAIGRLDSKDGFKCLDILVGGWSLFNKKHVVVFGYSNANFQTNSSVNPNYSNQRNIFIQSGLRFTIRKLTKTQFWITAEHNNLNY